MLAFGHDQGFTRVTASGKLASMFVIELTYKAPLKNIDASLPAHMKFVKKYYALGHFLISGRKIPREGGIILAVGDSREQIEKIARGSFLCARIGRHSGHRVPGEPAFGCYPEV